MGQSYLKYNFSDIEGSNCYCSDEAAEQIRALVCGMDPATPLWMGSGDYHYISLFRGEALLRSLEVKSLELIYFDNHPDDQDDAFGGGMLSCGNWVAWYRRLGSVQITWHNGDGAILQDTPSSQHGTTLPAADELPPVHLSIDLDVLSRDYAHTNWNQGEMTLDELCSRVSAIAAARRIACIDFCGGLSESKGGTPEDDALNTLAVETILGILGS